MTKNNNLILGGSAVRFITTKTGTHIVYFDAAYGRTRRLNLANATHCYLYDAVLASCATRQK